MASRTDARWLGAVLVLTAALYAPTLGHPYVYEDANWVRAVDSAPSLTVPGRGLTVLTHHLTWQIVGAEPAASHAVNVALHLLTGTLVYAVTAQIAPVAALGAAALFLLHPLNSAAVAYVMGRADLLMTFGVLLAVWCALRGGWWLMALLPALWIAGASKEIGLVGVPLVVLTVLLYRRQAWGTRWIVAGAVISLGAVCGLAYAALTRWLTNDPTLGGSALPWPDYVALQNGQLWHLLALVVWPVGFSIDHDTLALSSLALLVAGVLTAAALALVVLLWRRRPLVAWSLGWVLVAVAPRVVFRTSEFLTEVQLYLPFVGISVLVGCLLARACSPNRSSRSGHSEDSRGGVMGVLLATAPCEPSGLVLLVPGVVQRAVARASPFDNATSFALPTISLSGVSHVSDVHVPSYARA